MLICPTNIYKFSDKTSSVLNKYVTEDAQLLPHCGQKNLRTSLILLIGLNYFIVIIITFNFVIHI